MAQARTFVRYGFTNDDRYYMEVESIGAWLHDSAEQLRAMPEGTILTPEAMAGWLDGRVETIRDWEAVRRMETGRPPSA